MAQPVIITPGDPAGIGPEIALKAWQAGRRNCVFMGDIPHFESVAAGCGLDISFKDYQGPDDCGPDDCGPDKQKCPVLPVKWARDPCPGRPDTANAAAVITAIEQATALVRQAAFSALVTNPIAKNTLYEAGFSYPGHTEFLAALDQPASRPVMMLANAELRVVPLTIHVPLSEAEARITQADIHNVLSVMAADMKKYFGIRQPRIAVAGLNPHAGENGHIGRFETDILSPALQTWQQAGGKAQLAGPFSADSLFHSSARANYDAVLCMYHDQALIPVKTIDFFSTVNITLGLSFIRTSPDHGTAFDRADKFNARPDSLCAAIDMAQKMARQRLGQP